MANKDLKRNPNKLSDRVWWYECADGIYIVVDFGGGEIQDYKISWRVLRSAIKRKDK